LEGHCASVRHEQNPVCNGDCQQGTILILSVTCFYQKNKYAESVYLIITMLCRISEKIREKCTFSSYRLI